MLVLGVLVGCSGGSGDDTTAATDPATSAVPPTASPAPTAPGRTPVGFRAGLVEVTGADGSVLVPCVWLADTAELRARGLMEVDGLGGADGMLFRFGAPTGSAFYMLKTRIPLSIAYFDEGGAFVGAQDMVPCPDDDDDPPCPRYPAPGPFTDALEVAAGDLGRLGVGPGSTLRRLDRACVPGSTASRAP